MRKQDSPDTPDRRWTFGHVVLDERSLELIVEGKHVQLERKPLEVLIYLLHHAGEVVTKDELAEAVWPGRILTETVLTRCISLIRHALRDEARTLIRTVHRYGYRLVADITVEASTSSGPPVFDFQVGDHPLHRAQWKLLERLGRGGHGEVWLARHEKTGEQRVFKFALDDKSLSSLKREITLYRVLRENLGAHAGVVRIFEWNLTEPPYFVEAEYIAGGNLQSFAQASGGLGNIPIATRLELVAQIADVLGAAHSVGVLHKDLKPTNVLIQTDPTARSVRLCDFGSGAVLDPARLEALGITKHGFTSQIGDWVGTPLYLAPEVIGGQPSTVQADIYSLGVLLFQMVVGDLQKALAPGWENDVEDELLRADIALAAAGNPSRRLADATQLAVRLRTLTQRHRLLTEERAATIRTERLKQTLLELSRAKAMTVVSLGLAVIAFGAVVVAYMARNEALAATTTAQAISRFLMDDVLAVDPSVERFKDASYETLLGRAAAKIHMRFRDRPDAAASIHWLLGRRHQEVGQIDRAAQQYEEAVKLLPQLTGLSAEPALLALDRLLPILLERGEQAEAIRLSNDLRARWDDLYGRTSLSTLFIRSRIARLLLHAGELEQADRELTTVLREIPSATPDDIAKTLLAQSLGVALSTDLSTLSSNEAMAQLVQAHLAVVMGSRDAEYADEYSQGAAQLRRAQNIYSNILGPANETTTMTGLFLSYAITPLGYHEEAEKLINLSASIFRERLQDAHWLHAIPSMFLARLHIEQRRTAEAISALNQSVRICGLDRCSRRIRDEISYELGRAYLDHGDTLAAIETLRTSLIWSEAVRGKQHISSLRRRVTLADALRQHGDESGALAVLSQVDQEAITRFKDTLWAAEFRRLQGLLRQNSVLGLAIDSLEEASRTMRKKLGVNHWRTERVNRELAALQRLASNQASNSSGGRAGVKK